LKGACSTTLPGTEKMDFDQGFANQAASLRAGIAASVMLVVICFAVALVLSDRPVLAEGNDGDTNVSSSNEFAEAAR